MTVKNGCAGNITWFDLSVTFTILAKMEQDLSDARPKNQFDGIILLVATVIVYNEGPQN